MLEFNYKFAVLSAKYEIEGRSWLAFAAQALSACGGLLSLCLLITTAFGGLTEGAK